MKSLVMTENFFKEHFEKAKDLLSKSDYENAIVEFKKALKFDKNNYKIYRFLGIAYLAIGQLRETIEASKKANELNPEYSEFLNSQVNEFEKNGKIDDAINSVSKAIEINSTNATNYSLIGGLYFKKKLINEGVDAFNKAISLDPDSESFFRISLSNYYLEQNLIDEAIFHLEEVMKKEPALLFLISESLNDLYLKKGDFKKSLEVLEFCFSQNPRNMGVLKTLIKLVKKRTDQITVKKLLKQAIDSFPLIRNNGLTRSIEIHQRNDLIRLLIDEKCFKEAKQFSEDSIRLYPETFNFRILLGDILLRIGLIEDAMNEFEIVIQMEPDNYDNLYNISEVIRDPNWNNQVFWKTGIINGIELFKKIESKKYDDAEVKNILGLMYFDFADYGNAISYFVNAINLGKRWSNLGDSPSFHINLAEALKNCGCDFIDWAIREYQEAIKLDRKYYDARFELIRLLQKKNRTDEALNECIEGLNIFPKNVSFEFLYAIEVVKKGNIKESMNIFHNEIKDLNDAPVYLYEEWVELLIQNGFVKEAEEIVKEAREFLWEYNSTYTVLGTIFVKQGKIDDAISLYKEQIGKFKGFDGYFNLGEAYLLKNQMDNAIECYKNTLKIDSKHYEAHKRLAEIFTAKGLVQEALNEYKAIIDLDPKNIEIYDEFKKLKLKEAEKEAMTKKIELQLKDINERIDEFEKKFRRFIHSILIQHDKKYWENTKFDKKEEIDGRIDDVLRKNPYWKKQDIDPLEYFTIMDYYSLISNQWTIFENIFRDRHELRDALIRISTLRNPIKHVRAVSSPTIKLGEAGIEWFDLIFKDYPF